jgi:hypothetical protein
LFGSKSNAEINQLAIRVSLRLVDSLPSSAMRWSASSAVASCANGCVPPPQIWAVGNE